jgi:hypothetical protein
MLSASTATSVTANGGPPPEDPFRVLYERAESTTAQALEDLVNRPSVGRLLAGMAENVSALSRIGADLADLVVRNLRVAGRADVVRLARQIHRNEDTLERVLQEIEALRDRLGPSTDPTSRGADDDQHQ